MKQIILWMNIKFLIFLKNAAHNFTFEDIIYKASLNEFLQNCIARHDTLASNCDSKRASQIHSFLLHPA